MMNWITVWLNDHLTLPMETASHLPHNTDTHFLGNSDPPDHSATLLCHPLRGQQSYQPFQDWSTHSFHGWECWCWLSDKSRPEDYLVNVRYGRTRLAPLPQSRTTLSVILAPEFLIRLVEAFITIDFQLKFFLSPLSFPKMMMIWEQFLINFLIVNLLLRVCYPGKQITSLPGVETSSAELMHLTLLQFGDWIL